MTATVSAPSMGSVAAGGSSAIETSEIVDITTTVARADSAPSVAVTCAVPGLSAATNPTFTAATCVASDVQVDVDVTSAVVPSEYRTVAEKFPWPPTGSVSSAGATASATGVLP